LSQFPLSSDVNTAPRSNIQLVLTWYSLHQRIYEQWRYIY